ncbi:MAG: hypothetical protein K6F99_07670 [Lachnospiraceae bacterium]|nr:hypothetical protein [Lachnospiraceae bacterium]
MNSLYPLLTGKYIEGVTDLDRLITPAVVNIFRRIMKNYVRDFNCPELSSEEKKAVRDFYKRYKIPDMLYHRGYTARSGKFYAEYMPDDIYFSRVEPFYTDRLCSKYLDNKCLYYSFFSNVKMPPLIAMRFGKYWVDGDFKLIGFEDVCRKVESLEQCVIKRATDSEGGYGVVFIEGEDRINVLKDFVAKNKTDLVIQESIKQHPAYSRLNESSVNTLRIMSLLTKEGVKIVSGAVRIGTKGSRVDNLCHGGIFCGVKEDGRLTETGLMDDGSVIKEHPQNGYVFSDIKLPYYDRAVELIKRAHPIMAHNKIAYWDIAIDEEGEAVLVETNLALGTIFSSQVCNGPLFGKDTKKILEEVFYHKNGKRRRKPYFGLNPRDYYYLRDNLLGILFGTYKSGYTHITLLNNAALKIIDRKLVKPVAKLFPPLTKGQLKAARDFYRPYVKRVNTDSHRVYTGKSGRFFPDYIPEEMHMCDIDRYLSDRDLSYYLDNKCYYYRLFPFAKQPEALGMRIGGIWMDKDYRVVCAAELKKILFSEDEIVIKAATTSEAGAGVHFVSFKDVSDKTKLMRLKEAVKKIDGDVIIQKLIKQHKDIAALHPESLNSIRIISLMIDNEVVILSRSLRLGVGSSKVDNAGAGGIFCGIASDGTLNGIATLEDGRVVTRHPDTGIEFKGYKLPCLDKCDEVIKRSHPVLGRNRLISWDLSVDEDSNVILIEGNLSLGGSHVIQEANGPFFGKYTRKVLNEVYGHK